MGQEGFALGELAWFGCGKGFYAGLKDLQVNRMGLLVEPKHSGHIAQHCLVDLHVAG